MSGAPTVLNMIVNMPSCELLPHKVKIVTGGSPPPPEIISRMEELEVWSRSLRHMVQVQD